MDQSDQQNKNVFTRYGMWLGLIAYLVLIFIVATVFLIG